MGFNGTYYDHTGGDGSSSAQEKNVTKNGSTLGARPKYQEPGAGSTQVTI